MLAFRLSRFKLGFESFGKGHFDISKVGHILYNELNTHKVGFFLHIHCEDV